MSEQTAPTEPEVPACRHWIAIGNLPHIRCDIGHAAPADCRGCADYAAGSRVEITEIERTRCEVWTRVMGYHRPVSAFNAGKAAEHSERTLFRESLVPGYHEQPTEDDGDTD